MGILSRFDGLSRFPIAQSKTFTFTYTGAFADGRDESGKGIIQLTSSGTLNIKSLPEGLTCTLKSTAGGGGGGRGKPTGTTIVSNCTRDDGYNHNSTYQNYAGGGGGGSGYIATDIPTQKAALAIVVGAGGGRARSIGETGSAGGNSHAVTTASGGGGGGGGTTSGGSGGSGLVNGGKGLERSWYHSLNGYVGCQMALRYAGGNGAGGVNTNGYGNGGHGGYCDNDDAADGSQGMVILEIS